MTYKYSFTKLINSDRLTDEIRSSAITVALDHIDTLGTAVDIYMKAELTATEEIILGDLINAHVNLSSESTNKYTSTGALIVDSGIHVGASDVSSFSIVTHDYSDRSTWYQKSVRVLGETLTPDVNNLEFSSVNSHWVNIGSLRLTFQYRRIIKRDGTFGSSSDWAVVVKINGSIVDTSLYNVDYTAGKITFNSAVDPLDVVTVDYSHTNNVAVCSEFILKPAANRKTFIAHTEVQFSKDLNFTKPIRFEIWAGGAIENYGDFGDAMFDAGYGQYRADYRSIRDFINVSNNGVGWIPACGGLAHDVLVFPFNYTQAIMLSSNLGMLLRLVLIDDEPIISGDIATATFYIETTAESP